MRVRPLAFLNAGDEAVINEVRGGRGLQSRLTAMGLAPGVRVRVVQACSGGPVLLAIGNTRLAIGRGQLHHVMVTDEQFSG